MKEPKKVSKEKNIINEVRKALLSRKSCLPKELDKITGSRELTHSAIYRLRKRGCNIAFRRGEYQYLGTGAAEKNLPTVQGTYSSSHLIEAFHSLNTIDQELVIRLIEALQFRKIAGSALAITTDLGEAIRKEISR